MSGKYIAYNSKLDRNSLDLNTVPPTSKVAVMPSKLYNGQSFLVPNYLCNNVGGGVRKTPSTKFSTVERALIAGKLGRCMGTNLNQCSESVSDYTPRDKSTDYIIDSEFLQHPDHFSRFAYPWCPNGYCNGNFSRGYNVPEACLNEYDVPQGVAPKRFYTNKYLDVLRSDSTASILERDTRLTELQ